MRKKLYFDDTFRIDISMYILIDNGKIREFEGADFMPFIINGHPQPEFKTFKLNSDFILEKVSEYDRKKLDIKGNYKVDCSYLYNKYPKDSYIKLNIFEKFIIDYSKKESIIHKINLAQKLLILVLLTLPTAFIVTQFKSCNQENKPSLNNTNSINKTITSAPIHSTQTIKLD